MQAGVFASLLSVHNSVRVHCPGFHMEVIDEHAVGGNAMIIALDLFAEGRSTVGLRSRGRSKVKR